MSKIFIDGRKTNWKIIIFIVNYIFRIIALKVRFLRLNKMAGVNNGYAIMTLFNSNY